MFIMNDNQGMIQEENQASSLKRGERVEKVTDKVVKAHRNIQWNCIRVLCFNFKLNCSSKCIKWFCCCPKINKQERILTRDYIQFEKEIHVSYILKNLRILKTIARRSMPYKEW